MLVLRNSVVGRRVGRLPIKCVIVAPGSWPVELAAGFMGFFLVCTSPLSFEIFCMCKGRSKISEAAREATNANGKSVDRSDLIDHDPWQLSLR